MRIEDGKLVLETRKCWDCQGSGQKQEIVDIRCPKCNGTGRGPRGGRRGCKKCYGDGKTWKRTDNLVDCNTCKGTGDKPEDFYDHCTDDFWRALDFKVYNTMHRQTFYEAHIGAGCWSTTDYGDYARGTAGDLIEKVKAHRGGVQVCNLIRDTGYRTYLDEGDPRRRDTDPTICDHIGIFTNTQGYTVAGVFVDGNGNISPKV